MKTFLTRSFRFLLSIMLFVTLIHFNGCKEDEKPTKNLDCIPMDLQENVIAFYSFAEGSLNNFTGNGKKLKKVGAVQAASDRFGNPNAAYALDNIPAENNMYLMLSDPSFLADVKQFSISLWYAPSDPTRDGGIYEGLIHRGEDFRCDGRGAWSIGLYDCRIPVYAATSTLWDEMISLYCEAEVTLRTDHWDYITATYDADTKEMVLYVNGEYRGATNANDGCRNPIDEIGALFLGYGYTGRIDDVAIFNKVLSEDEVDVMYAADACL